MMKQKSIIKQKGFTLLELLVVITLLAILAVGGLVAYDGVGENAESSAGAYNIASLDRAVRQYRAVTNTYPDQWDNLSDPAAALPAGGSNFLAETTQQVFGSWNIGGAEPAFRQAVVDRIRTVWGMEEIQQVVSPFDGTAAPGKMHNEGTGFSREDAFFDEDNNNVWTGDFSHISIAPSANGDTGEVCTVGTQQVSNTFADGAVAGAPELIAMARRLNAMNDAMGIERCHLVIALGFGGDAASSTSRASVNIPAAPTYTSPNVNPAVNYGRYVGLFHMGRTDSGAGETTIGVDELFARPKLIGFVTPEGQPVDVLVQGTRSEDN